MRTRVHRRRTVLGSVHCPPVDHHRRHLQGVGFEQDLRQAGKSGADASQMAPRAVVLTLN
jgi:hypothetical protein